MKLSRESAKLFCAAKQPRVDKIKQRPKIREPVLNRRAGHGYPVSGLQSLDASRLLCAGIFYGLGFIEYDAIPLALIEPFVLLY